MTLSAMCEMAPWWHLIESRLCMSLLLTLISEEGNFGSSFAFSLIIRLIFLSSFLSNQRARNERRKSYLFYISCLSKWYFEKRRRLSWSSLFSLLTFTIFFFFFSRYMKDREKRFFRFNKDNGTSSLAFPRFFQIQTTFFLVVIIWMIDDGWILLVCRL